MKKLRFSLNLLAGALLVLAFSSAANAQASRTWVSGLGDDANPCSRTAPCKTFPGAYSRTAAGGEIDCLDPGGFGTLTISKAITIDCDSGAGGVLASPSVNGFTINAGPADHVTIRNLNFNGVSQTAFPGLSGIKINSGLSVHLQQVDIFNFLTDCVEVSATANVQLTIENSSFTNCGTAGIKTNTTTGAVNGDFHNIRIWNAGNGINAQNGSRLTVTNSVIGLANPGINQSGLSGLGSVVLVTNSTLANSGTAALQSVAGATMTACNNTFAANALIFNTNGGVINSCGDNKHLPTDPQGSAPGPAPVI